MSTTIEPKKKVTPPPPDNPWYYGWRDTFETLPDGTRKHVQIPLTLEDCLHPQEGDTVLESDMHAWFLAYLFLVFRNRVKDDPTALILSDTGIYWDHPELEHHSPDISVIFGIKKQKPVWPSFFVRDEGVKPHSIIELVSPNTRPNDLEAKMHDYHLAEVPYYFIFDKKKEGDDWSLRGYQWTPMTYVPLNPDPQGRLWYRKLGLLLAAEGKNIVCYDGKTGEKIPNYLELDQAKQDVSALAEAEKQRADAEKQRADAEKQRADAEARAREAAEETARELQAELARLRNP